MSAEGLLDNPSLFSPNPSIPPRLGFSPSPNLSKSAGNSNPNIQSFFNSLFLVHEYLKFTELFPRTPVDWIGRHVARIAKLPLRATNLYERITKTGGNLEIWREILIECEGYLKNGTKYIAPVLTAEEEKAGKMTKKQLREAEHRRKKLERRKKEREEKAKLALILEKELKHSEGSENKGSDDDNGNGEDDSGLELTLQQKLLQRQQKKRLHGTLTAPVIKPTLTPADDRKSATGSSGIGESNLEGPVKKKRKKKRRHY